MCYRSQFFLYVLQFFKDLIFCSARRIRLNYMCLSLASNQTNDISNFQIKFSQKKKKLGFLFVKDFYSMRWAKINILNEITLSLTSL